MLSDKRKRLTIETAIKQKKRRRIRKPALTPLSPHAVASPSNSIDFVIFNIIMMDSNPTLIGRDRKGKRVVWKITDYRPYFYFGDPGQNIENEDLLTLLFNKAVAKYLRGLKIVHSEIVRGKPLFGYQKNTSPFVKAYVFSERERMLVHKWLSRLKSTNFYEYQITTLERFKVDTGISVGQRFVLPISEMRGLQKINEHYVVEYTKVRTLLEQTMFKRVRSTAWTHKVVVFRLLIRTPKKRAVYPIAYADEETMKQRGVECAKNHPVVAIVCTVSDGRSRRNHIFSTIYVDRPDEKNYGQTEIFVTDRKKPSSKSELQIISMALNLIKKTDILLGYKVMDSNFCHSLQYLLKRRMYHGRSSMLLDGSRSMNVRTALQPKNKETMSCRNPFNFVSVVDILDFAHPKNYSRIVNSSFEEIYEHITGRESYSDRQFSELALHVDARTSASSWKIERNSDSYTNIFEETLDKCWQHLEIFEQEKVFESMIMRAETWGVELDYVWSCGQSRIFKHGMLKTIAEMKRHNDPEVYYVICDTTNFSHARRRSQEFYTDKNDESDGGRHVKVKHHISLVPTLEIDISSYYYSILRSYGLDYPNIISYSEQDFPTDTGNFPIIRGYSGSAEIGVVQMHEDTLPFIRYMKSLQSKRDEIKRQIKMLSEGIYEPSICSDIERSAVIAFREDRAASSPSPVIQRLKMMEKVIKLTIVAPTGCLTATFDFVFRNMMIGKTMRSIGRKIFDYSCSTVSRIVLHENPQVRFKMVSGHTDGFSVAVLNAESDQDLKDLANGVIRQLNLEAQRTPCGFSESKKPHLPRYIKFKLDGISKASVYNSSSDHIKMVLEGTNGHTEDHCSGQLKHVGSFCIKTESCTYEKTAYLNAVLDLMTKGSMSGVATYLKKIKEPIDELNRGQIPESSDKFTITLNNLIRYKRATSHFHLEKFNPLSTYEPAIIMRRYQSDPRFEYEVPAINQMVPYVLVYDRASKKTIPILPEDFDSRNFSICAQAYIDQIEKQLKKLEKNSRSSIILSPSRRRKVLLA